MNWVISPLQYSKKQTSMIRRKFTQEEDSKLCQLVNQYGAKKWDQIAKMMPGRTGRQCRDRYRNYLIPGFFNGQWSQEEDELLHEKFKQMGRQWARMMQFFPGRSANSLKNRWNYFVCRLNQEQKKNEEATNINVGANKGISNNKKETQTLTNNEIPNSGLAINETPNRFILNNDIIYNELPNFRVTANELPSLRVANNELINKAPGDENLPNKPHQDNTQTYPKPQEPNQPEPEQEERIIYGVNAGTQTNESDLIEHERLMRSS